MDQDFLPPPNHENKSPKERKRRLPPEDLKTPRPNEPYVELIAKVYTWENFSFIYIYIKDLIKNFKLAEYQKKL